MMLHAAESRVESIANTLPALSIQPSRRAHVRNVRTYVRVLCVYERAATFTHMHSDDERNSSHARQHKPSPATAAAMGNETGQAGPKRPLLCCTLSFRSISHSICHSIACDALSLSHTLFYALGLSIYAESVHVYMQHLSECVLYMGPIHPLCVWVLNYFRIFVRMCVRARERERGCVRYVCLE